MAQLPQQVKVIISNNTSGANQHARRRLLDMYPQLPTLISGYLNSSLKISEICEALEEDHNIKIGKRSIERIITTHDIQTVRRNEMTLDEKGYHILRVTQDDPLGQWGYRLVQEKLAAEGVHISRDEVMKFRSHENPAGTAARHPATRKVHHHGLYSAGPDEEWCIDGHEKILNSMGIAVYGVIDKYSRMELGLWAVPNARLADVPPMLYLKLVREQGGIPVTTVSDMGAEVSKLIPLVTTLQNLSQPFLTEDDIQSFRTTKSVYNITRERAWGPIYGKDLSNILFFYKAGEISIGYNADDHTHKGTALWVWSQVVQKTLDRILQENRKHRVRFQKKSLLPTGDQRIKFYTKPEKWGGKPNLLIPVPPAVLDQFGVYDKPEVLQFGDDECVEFCKRRYAEIGSPTIKAQCAWLIFAMILELPIPENWSSTGIPVLDG